ncbi:hypothetical protein ACSSS7_003505 [Eimeria intestinalis]
MFACCCGDTSSPRTELRVQPEGSAGVQAAPRKSAGGVAAAAPAAASAVADDQEERARAAEARAAAADGPDSNAVAVVEAAAAAAAYSGVAAAVAADATAAEARQEARTAQETAPAKSVVITTTKKETAPTKKPLTPLALAWLKPLVAVPGHKFKDTNKYCQGWVKFIQIANEYPAKLMLLDNFAAAEAPDVQLLQLVEGPGAKDESSCVAEAITEYNKLYDLKNVKAIAVVPLSSTLIETGKTVAPQRFLQMGTGEGDAAPIQIKRAATAATAISGSTGNSSCSSSSSSSNTLHARHLSSIAVAAPTAAFAAAVPSAPVAAATGEVVVGGGVLGSIDSHWAA